MVFVRNTTATVHIIVKDGAKAVKFILDFIKYCFCFWFHI